MAPFWMAEQAPEPVLPGHASSRVADSVPVSRILSIRGPTAQLRASELNEPCAVQMTETTCMKPLCVADNSMPAEYSSARPNRAVSEELMGLTYTPERPGVLARIGMFSRRRPLLVWVAGAILAFVLSATVTLIGKRLLSAGFHPGHGNSVTHSPMPR